MISLSRAIRQNLQPDPLHAACAALRCDFRMASKESAAVMALHALLMAWPQIGQSVRSWPRLAEYAEKLSPPLITKGGANSAKRTAHASLYKFITTLHDLHRYTNANIADLLEASRL